VAVVLAVSAKNALAASYGLGTFKGTVKALPGTRYAGGQRSSVTVVAKPGKVRIAQIGLILLCPDGEQYGLPPVVKATVSSAYVRVKRGPAGGGAIAKPRGTVTVNGKAFPISGEVFLGLRQDKILGNVEAKLTAGIIGCQDTARTFTAFRRP